jgi:GNAT superfamily N-acetyltransferase
VSLPDGLELRPWREEDLNSAGRLIAAAYHGHPDSVVNDQYRSVHGSMRFLNNIVRFSGCGAFSAQVSHVIMDRASREMVALVLGSRVSPESGHITQICVHPEFRRRGLARMMLTWPPPASCARASPKSLSPSPKPTPKPFNSTASKATTAHTASTPPSGSATEWFETLRESCGYEPSGHNHYFFVLLWGNKLLGASRQEQWI